jgi:hypothetical protein
MIIRCLIFLAMLLSPLSVAALLQTQLMDNVAGEPAESSVLANGRWYKIKIRESGIYRITYEELVSMGFTNPSNISLFGNGGKMLPLLNDMPRQDDLVENPVFMFKGTDGTFNQGDYILFYGQGPVTWEYNTDAGMFLHTIHGYSEATYYFLTESGQQLRIIQRSEIAASPVVEVRNFTDYSFHEKNRFNFLKSGRQWFGDRIDLAPFDSAFSFTNLNKSFPLRIKINVAGRSSLNKIFTLKHDTIIGKISTQGVNLQNKNGAHATQTAAYINFRTNKDLVNLTLTFNKTGSEDEGYLDYITINGRRQLTFTGDMMFFRDTSGMGTDAVAIYYVENCNSQTEIWDITNPVFPVKVPAHLSGTTLSFKDNTNSIRQYIAFNTAATFSKPVTDPEEKDLGVIPNQNLHSLGSHQMLIVTHINFKDAADSIAGFHAQHDGLSVAVVTTQQVFNEFSSGAPDISAIRDFAKMIYNRSASENGLKYLLLVGDGSYNNISGNKGNANFIPTYQSENSLNATFSYVSDDFFGLLEPGEGGSNFMENYTLDIGIGRLPVKTADEAMSIYRKIRNYHDPSTRGDWQNNIMFAGDDQDGNLHMNQANELANWVDANHPEFAVKKVLIDAYPQVASSTGTRYPDVNKTIKNNIEKGLLIFNYTGHGGEIGLADEQIFMREDLSELTNFKRLPLFITATCEFSRFDDLTRSDDGSLRENTSAGEFSILNPDGGTIALVSTTRIVYSGENHNLNSRFLQIALNRDEDGKYRTLGESMQMTKNVVGDSRNKLNFILLGDPALKLAIPEYKIITDSVNRVSISEPIDTMRAFSRIIISGHIEDNNNALISTFNGTIYPSVFDKKKTVTTLANDIGAFPLQFTVREDLLYKGKVSVSQGRFTFEFYVPKDITYSFGNGKITYYSHNQETDARGTFSNFIIGGTDRSAEPDYSGPEISLYLNDEYFNTTGLANQDPVIFAEINDESGINTIGNGIGHDITGIIDDDISNPIVMNDFFETNLDDFTSGILTYPMYGLEEGTHTLRLKVWDIYNNSSEATIEFRVVSDNRIVISKAGNYPNPALDHTTFTFEHNQAGDDLTATIIVFDLSGRIIYTHAENIAASGFNSSTPVWDLKDMNGNMLRPGIYPYRIRISDSNGSYSDSYQKLVVVR